MTLSTTRIVATSAAPELYQKLVELHMTAEGQAVAAGLDKGLLSLVKIRASQLNGCAFCVDMHSTEADALGEHARRLHGLAVWRQTEFFTPRERAALALTEAMTLLADASVPDEVYERAAREFSEAELAQLVWAVTVINAFNRLSVTSGLRPPSL